MRQALFKINFYWSIVALQCYIIFYCTAKWISYTYTFVPYLLDLFPIWQAFLMNENRIAASEIIAQSLVNTICSNFSPSWYTSTHLLAASPRDPNPCGGLLFPKIGKWQSKPIVTNVFWSHSLYFKIFWKLNSQYMLYMFIHIQLNLCIYKLCTWYVYDIPYTQKNIYHFQEK